MTIKSGTSLKNISLSLNSITKGKEITKIDANAVVRLTPSVHVGVNYVLPNGKFVPLFYDKQEKGDEEEEKEVVSTNTITNQLKDLCKGLVDIQNNTFGFIDYQRRVHVLKIL